MAPTNRATQANPTGTGRGVPASADLVDWGFLLVAVAILVGQTLIPSETPPEQGTQIPWQMLTLLATGTWLLLGLKRGRQRFDFRLSDALLATTVGWIALSGWLATGQGAPRAAINAMWQWVHVAILYTVLRQWIRTPAAARAVVAAMLALATAEAAIGLYQYEVAFPAMREQFAANPDAMLRAAGQWVPPESPQRRLLEDRILSREPLGTFALANSLAGLLVPWILIGLGISANSLFLFLREPSREPARADRQGAAGSRATIAAQAASPPRQPPATAASMLIPVASFRRALLATAIVLGPTVVVLLLTKSRAAYLAVVAGALLLAGRLSAVRLIRQPRRWLFFGVALCAALVAAVALWGGLDREVLTEAPKSLAYRFEYWQATCRMIADHPWCGVGPGQFQDRYTQYKLATASEEISDPHNFLLELAATGGLPAAVGFVAFLVAALWQLVPRPLRYRTASDTAHAAAAETSYEGDSPASPTSPASHQQQRRRQPPGSTARPFPRLPAADRVACGGPLLGVVAALVFGLAFPFLGIIPLSFMAAAGVAATVCVVVASWRPWLHKGGLPSATVAAAIGAMLLHLSASGGISYAGVATTLWTLLAIAPVLCSYPAQRRSRVTDTGSSTSTPQTEPPGGTPGWLRWLVTATWAVIAIGWYASAYRPVVRSQGYLWAAQHGATSPNETLQNLEAAVKADPYNTTAWDGLAQHLLDEWLGRQPDASPAQRRELRRQLDEAVHRLLASRPYSSVVWSRAADIYFAIYEHSRDTAALEQAVDALRSAARLYPTSASLHGRLALMLAEMGRLAAAREEARQALRLDRTTPHADKKLPAELRTALERLIAEPQPTRKPTAATTPTKPMP